MFRILQELAKQPINDKVKVDNPNEEEDNIKDAIYGLDKSNKRYLKKLIWLKKHDPDKYQRILND